MAPAFARKALNNRHWAKPTSTPGDVHLGAGRSSCCKWLTMDNVGVRWASGVWRRTRTRYALLTYALMPPRLCGRHLQHLFRRATCLSHGCVNKATGPCRIHACSAVQHARIPMLHFNRCCLVSSHFPESSTTCPSRAAMALGPALRCATRNLGAMFRRSH